MAPPVAVLRLNSVVRQKLRWASVGLLPLVVYHFNIIAICDITKGFFLAFFCTVAY